jgi:hypothetical protein
MVMTARRAFWRRQRSFVAANVDRRDDGRRLDVIGDVHGCVDELEALLGADIP